MTEPSIHSTVTLREITKDNLSAIFQLKVDESQEQFVAPNTMSIAQAYFDRERAWFRAIYADETAVGFLMLDDDPDKREYFLWRLMIDRRFQGLGYARRALELLIAHVKTRPGAVELKTSYVPGENGPARFYQKIGFVETGEILEGELVTSLKLAFKEGESPPPTLNTPHDEVRQLLQKFQDGYSKRDTSLLESFMQLFGPDAELEVIGTNAVKPGEGEWCKGTSAVRDLIAGDWEHWGDVVYDVQGANIFVQGDVAWIATSGTVNDVFTAAETYDGFIDYAKELIDDEEVSAKSKLLAMTQTGNSLLSSLLLPERCIWPFRLTAVALKNNGQWRFQQIHFSFPTTGMPDERIIPEE